MACGNGGAGFKCSNATKNACLRQGVRGDTKGHIAVAHLHYSVQPGTLCEDGNMRSFKDTGFCFF